MPLVIALAGRRIDAAEADEPRFPLDAVPRVRERLRALFAARHATALVCSAACGADLVALEVAGDLGLRCRVVLPFATERFRDTSVVDRPGDWGPAYDRIIAAVRRAGDLVVLDDTGEGSAAYEAANRCILEEASTLATDAPAAGSTPSNAALAVIVWDGRARGPDDATQHFANLAKERGMRVEEVGTG